ncbi:hypothetical protein XFF6991_530138 [Xanthomonas phaseoli pv. phaseoli]|uniref:Uncharacterized protein n=1 Tax=Xanthomonas campestris pv. phaseoli TaxID=317013 RepID=A0A7Z7J2T9_XANCH|nr:hypothetical protein XFF6991_530138 [Xanthomonas phaseoli pv. phaseoli]
MHAPAHGRRIAPLWCVDGGIDVYVLNAWKSGFRPAEQSTFKHEIVLRQASNHGQSAWLTPPPPGAKEHRLRAADAPALERPRYTRGPTRDAPIAVTTGKASHPCSRMVST